MKKLLLLLCLALASGCSSSTEEDFAQAVENTQDPAAVIVEKSDSSVTIEAKKDLESFGEALEVLKDQGLLEWNGSNDSMGLYITEVDSTSADSSENTYWAFYTDLLEDGDVIYASLDSGSFTVEDHKLAYASYGVSSVPFRKGYWYALVFETYQPE